MAVATFDTLKFANTLKAAGVPDKQAEAQAAALDATLRSLRDDLDRRIEEHCGPAQSSPLRRLEAERSRVKLLALLTLIATWVLFIFVLFVPVK